MQRTPAIYLDTSVIGGCADEEFARWSLQLINEIDIGLFKPYVSALTELELTEAPDNVLEFYFHILDSGCEVLSVSHEAEELADKYIERQIVSPKFRTDCLHIAIATVNNLDIVISWNFRHIVHYEKIIKFNAVNLEMGYKYIDIHSPMEVIHYEVS